MKIASVIARQVLDCKARPLLEVEITTDTGYVGRDGSADGYFARRARGVRPA